jgi:hypothetical protein
LAKFKNAAEYELHSRKSVMLSTTIPAWLGQGRILRPLPARKLCLVIPYP